MYEKNMGNQVFCMGAYQCDGIDSSAASYSISGGDASDEAGGV